jgi:hypothetical protein
MSKRREFTRKQRAQIVARATDPNTGRLCCEGCSLVLGLKPYEIDHTIPEGLLIDKTKPLTIEDGKLLGKDCCHRGGPDGKTANDIRMIRKSDRVRDKHTRASKKKSRMVGSKDSPIRMTVQHGPVWRDTGLPVNPRGSR